MEKPVIFRETAVSQRKMASSESGVPESGMTVSGEGFITDDPDKEINITETERMAFCSAAERLDSLEGKLVESESEDVCLLYEEDALLEEKVHDTLRRHLDFWVQSGASDFAV